MEIDQETYAKIEAMIHSDTSPVGIDAKKTHVYIIHMLMQIQERLTALEEQRR
ncbi:MAG: hypothetical protein V3T86_13250 [Planctomycetota bacterium]